MKCRILSGLVISLLMIACSALGQSSSVHQQIEQIYNFQPHLLSRQEITQKSATLDQFWTKAKAEPVLYVPALREELSNSKNPPFFLYDGSMLLLSLSNVPADRKLALAAMARCDLRDVRTTDYFLQVHRMAALNDDTTAAAFHLLAQPDFKVFIPQHSLTLGQNYALVYLLLPTNQDYWVKPAVDRLKSEKDEVAQKSLILLLWYAQTDDADNAILAFAADSSKPSGSRDYAKGFMGMKDKIRAKKHPEVLASGEASLRQKRQERLKVVSDEALIDLDDFTMKLVEMRK